MPASIHIKNMVCARCVMTVENIFREHGLEPLVVSLGEVRLAEPVSIENMKQIDESLKSKGFELIDDKGSLLLEKAKTLIIDQVHHHNQFELKLNWSDFLSEKLSVDYGTLSSLFSSVNGITIEQYIIAQKIEKVKEYLFYDELSVKEIAFKLGYSSVAHLSTQFKKVTGLTPTEFKESRDLSTRKSLDQV